MSAPHDFLWLHDSTHLVRAVTPVSLYLLKCTLTYLVTAYPNVIGLEMRLLLLSLFKVRLIYAADNNRMSLCFQYWNAHNLLIPTSVVLWPVIFSPFPFPILNLYCKLSFFVMSNRRFCLNGGGQGGEVGKKSYKKVFWVLKEHWEG